MKKNTKIISFFLVILFTIGLLSSCSLQRTNDNYKVVKEQLSSAGIKRLDISSITLAGSNVYMVTLKNGNTIQANSKTKATTFLNGVFLGENDFFVSANVKDSKFSRKEKKELTNYFDELRKYRPKLRSKGELYLQKAKLSDEIIYYYAKMLNCSFDTGIDFSTKTKRYVKGSYEALFQSTADGIKPIYLKKQLPSKPAEILIGSTQEFKIINSLISNSLLTAKKDGESLKLMNNKVPFGENDILVSMDLLINTTLIEMSMNEESLSIGPTFSTENSKRVKYTTYICSIPNGTYDIYQTNYEPSKNYLIMDDWVTSENIRPIANTLTVKTASPPNIVANFITTSKHNNTTTSDGLYCEAQFSNAPVRVTVIDNKIEFKIYSKYNAQDPSGIAADSKFSYCIKKV